MDERSRIIRKDSSHLTAYELWKVMRARHNEAVQDVYVLLGWRLGKLLARAVIGRENALEAYSNNLGGWMSCFALIDHKGYPIRERGHVTFRAEDVIWTNLKDDR
jgi:hypothetical protein